jgi:ABC-2 type transport system ATP-binding protein
MSDAQPDNPQPSDDSRASSRASDLAIDLSHVAKTYKGKVRALRGISMRVRRGEVYGLLGPNGAGKSTLVKILMTVISPSQCEGTMLGQRVGHKPTLARVGYLPEHHKFPSYLTGNQVIDFYGSLGGVAKADRRTRSAELLDLVGMSDWGHKKVGGYSKGMRQRLGIAQALIADPDVVFLDEPTDGVDPVGRKDIRDVLATIRDRGKTVFLNSHLLSELEMICDRVGIMVKGEIRQEGTIDELTVDQHRYQVKVPPEHGAVLAEVTTAISHPPASDPVGEWSGSRELSNGSYIRAHADLGRAEINSADPALIQPLIDALRAKAVPILDVRGTRPSLEDLFMQAVTDPDTGRAMSVGAIANTKRSGSKASGGTSA